MRIVLIVVKTGHVDASNINSDSMFEKCPQAAFCMPRAFCGMTLLLN